MGWSARAVSSATQSPNDSWNAASSGTKLPNSSGRSESSRACPVSWATVSVLDPDVELRADGGVEGLSGYIRGAAEVASAAYALLASALIYRSISFKQLYTILLSSAKSTTSV